MYALMSSVFGLLRCFWSNCLSLPWPAFFCSCLVLRGAVERYMNWRLPRKGLGYSQIFVHLLRTHTHIFGHILKAIIFFPDMEIYKLLGMCSCIHTLSIYLASVFFYNRFGGTTKKAPHLPPNLFLVDSR